MDQQEILQKITRFLEQYITPYLVADYKEKLQLFDLSLFAVLGIILFLSLLVVLSRNKFSERDKENFRDTTAAILVVNEISWHLWAYFYGEWTLQAMLPLHISSLLVWISVLMLIRKSYYLYEFVYLIGIGGALQALLIPNAGAYGFPHIRFFQTSISYGFIILAAIYMTIIEEMRPTWKSLLRVFIFANLYMAAVYGINTLIDSNYLYVNAKPAASTLLYNLPDWPIYILYAEGIGIATSFVLYLPFLIKDIISYTRLKFSGKSRLDDMLS